MKFFLRVVSLITLASFLGLVSVEGLHSHQDSATPSHCTLCQAAHQAPALLNIVVRERPVPIVETAVLVATPPAAILFAAVSHGLAPPQA